jgi:Chaperone for wingless signalling and trafficking of LDL receptor
LLAKLDMSNPESMMKLSKKGKTVMMFVRVNRFVDRDETEQITSIWQTGLYNNHVQASFDQLPVFIPNCYWYRIRSGSVFAGLLGLEIYSECGS